MSLGESVPFLDRLRQPEYTGENRCLPCTVVNVLIAAFLSVPVAVVSPAGAAAVFGLLLAVVYLRGYLVPGTPALTKRYLPVRVLEWFGKAPQAEVGAPSVGDANPTGEEAADADDRNLLSLLDDAGLVTDCPDRDDVCLTPAFRRAWEDGVEDVGEVDPETAARALGVDADRVHRNPEGAFYLTSDEDRTVQWGSSAAVRADLGAVDALEESYPEWASLPLAVRYQALQGLRLFLETCPSCGGAVSTATRRVDSCCAELTVDVLECESCEETFLELDRQSAGGHVTEL